MSIIIRLLDYIKYAKKSFALGILSLFLSAALGVYLPVIGKDLIDYVAQHVRDHQPVAISYLVIFVLIYIAVATGDAVFRYLAYYMMSNGSNTVSKVIRDQAHEKMQVLPISYFDNKPAGKISARIVNDTEVLRQSFYQNFCNQILINLFIVVGIYIALFMVNAQVGWIFLCLVPFFILWQYLYVKVSTPVNHISREAVSTMTSQVAELVQGFSIVQAFGRQPLIKDEFEEVNQTWLKSRYKSQWIDAFINWCLSDFMKNIGILIILNFIGQRFFGRGLGSSVGTVYLLIDYVSRLFDPITNIMRLMTMVQQSIVAAERVFGIIDEPAEADSDQIMTIDQGRVEFDQVSFAYKAGQPVLKDLNFVAEPGMTVGLVGHTGSGKSSIMNLLFRFYDPQEGQIRIDGKNIGEYSRESVRQDMGIVLQEPYLFSGTIASNVSMNDPAISREAIHEALLQVGAGPMLNKLEKGMDEPVFEKGQAFSSGERQLISFARTIASNPKILILDEATSHIDTATEEIIQNALKVLQEGRTSFIIAHRLSTIQHADMILVLDKGEIIERGKHEDLMAINGIYAEMYQMQAKVS